MKIIQMSVKDYEKGWCMIYTLSWLDPPNISERIKSFVAWRITKFFWCQIIEVMLWTKVVEVVQTFFQTPILSREVQLVIPIVTCYLRSGSSMSTHVNNVERQIQKHKKGPMWPLSTFDDHCDWTSKLRFVVHVILNILTVWRHITKCKDQMRIREAQQKAAGTW